ncbi:SAM-dependent methyltransferase [Rubricella aquisinus]|uniref:SAM-dependent methyltransferase n=1 Tax=Rubricella aquisinus TaxID=2028108 RepID=A0A840WQD5_9RHOB|nr:class I SAM-dependent methyltransferase [Rubricella aquisinus]MBB5516263.1 SAM-dependent methyltransferase [Rubricella aquisinus]
MTDARDWQGRVGQEWARRADALDALLGPVGEAAFGPLEHAARVLDVGCGAGESALTLALRGKDVTALDLSRDLLEVARARDVGGRVKWVEGDAARFTADPPFDALHSRCGVMFFDDPVGAMRHLRGQIEPGGTLSVITWQDAALNAWARLPLDIARPVLGEALTSLPPAGGAGPFGWADQDYVDRVLRQAGWRDVVFTEINRPAEVGYAMDADGIEAATLFFTRIGTLASRLRNVEKPLRDKVKERLRDALAAHQRADGTVWLDTAAWHITASA